MDLSPASTDSIERPSNQLPSGGTVSVGDVVMCYDQGWRTGRVEEIIKTAAWIRVTPAIGKVTRSAVMFGFEDIRQIGGD